MGLISIQPRHPARLLARSAAVAAQRVLGTKPVPLKIITRIRKLAGRPNALSPSTRALSRQHRLASDHSLRDRLADFELGPWTIDGQTITFLERVIRTVRPNVILEFGSGVSTLCLATFLSLTGGEKVISIEQDEDHLQATESSLRRAGLLEFAELHLVPVGPVRVGQDETVCYQLTELDPFPLFERIVDLVFIDGPAGEGPVRFGTLPMVLPYLSAECVFFMDDGLRDEEIETASRWQQMSKIDVQGVYVIGKGVVAGCAYPMSGEGS